MRNTVTLNGVNSSLIQGLLIQELPPITKPMIRTQIEEIDGRDGDIITKLGYSAYDKEVSIGLFGNFDIDDIITFFNSEGEVIFSNEPTKYYKYQILEQIDYERLIRFRTATVTFHVQPFKYSAVEKTKTFLIEQGTESVTVVNTGNYFSRPKITIHGSGTINIGLNGIQLFVINMDEDTSITIDTNAMEAYSGMVLKNRQVTGDYKNFILNTGSNTITWTGSISKIEVENYSRWL